MWTVTARTVGSRPSMAIVSALTLALLAGCGSVASPTPGPLVSLSADEVQWCAENLDTVVFTRRLIRPMSVPQAAYEGWIAAAAAAIGVPAPSGRKVTLTNADRDGLRLACQDAYRKARVSPTPSS